MSSTCDRSVMLLVAVVVTAIMPAIAVQAAVPLELPRTIAFSRTNGTGTHIFSIEPDGTELTQLTSGPDVDSKPAWNVDASAITFTRRSASTTDVWIMNPDGSDPHVFLPNASSLVWSPSGEGVAFVRIRNGNHDIWTAGADGTHRIRLTTDGARDVQPVWPLEGRLWFVSDRSGRDRIYSMKSDGTGLVRLTSGPGEQRQPSGNGVELVYEQDDGNEWTRESALRRKRRRSEPRVRACVRLGAGPGRPGEREPPRGGSHRSRDPRRHRLVRRRRHGDVFGEPDV